MFVCSGKTEVRQNGSDCFNQHSKGSPASWSGLVAECPHAHAVWAVVPLLCQKEMLVTDVLSEIDPLVRLLFENLRISSSFSFISVFSVTLIFFSATFSRHMADISAPRQQNVLPIHPQKAVLYDCRPHGLLSSKLLLFSSGS